MTATYPGDIRHIAAVRAMLRELVDGCPVADEAILCASELAANAALHSNSRLPGGTFAVSVSIQPGGHIRIEVEDGGGPWTPRQADPWRSHGLDIIRDIAADWNVRGDHRSRIVSARIDWPAPVSHDDTGHHGTTTRP